MFVEIVVQDNALLLVNKKGNKIKSLKKHSVVTILLARANINKALSTIQKRLNHHCPLGIPHKKQEQEVTGAQKGQVAVRT